MRYKPNLLVWLFSKKLTGRYREKGNFAHCGNKLAPPLWKTVWALLKIN
jgi:hypothetical protein